MAEIRTCGPVVAEQTTRLINYGEGLLAANNDADTVMAFLRGGGEMAAMIAAKDWRRSSVGGSATWPSSLRASISLALGAPVPMFVAWGPELVLIYNDYAAGTLGHWHPDMLGAPLSDLLRRIELADRVSTERVLAGETVFLENVRIILPGSGSSDFRWANLSLSPIRDDAGDVAGICVMVRDVTQRVINEQRAIESERHYRMLFDRMGEGFCVIEFIDDPHAPLSDYVHVEANAAYSANAGIPDVTGKRVREILGDEADQWIARYGEVLRTGQPIRFEQELVATGRYLSLSAFRLEPAEQRRVAVLVQDVTDRRKAELDLRYLNRTLEARVAAAVAERKLLVDIVEGTNAFVQVSDMDFRWLAINRHAADEFESVFGIRPRVGNSMLAILDGRPELQAAVREVWRRALEGEEFVELGVFDDEKQGRRHYEMRFGVLRDAEGRQIGAYQFVYDVSERLHEQERLREAEEALRQAQKMEAVGQLTGGLAHDFNNLLAGISGAFEMIGVRLAQGRSADVDKYLGAGQGASRRAAALTHRLLAFARRQTLAPKPIIVNRLLSELVELVQRTVGPAISVETIAASGLWPSLVDSNQLENAILNLCINARDAMPTGGKITIETCNRWLDARTARDHGLEPGQYVTVCVSDTGIGIDKSVIGRVFDPFFTTKPIGEGTGLGLSMVYGFARQSNGHVRIYSEVGQGTMVCIYLPRYLGEEMNEDPVTGIKPAEAAIGETILVVDDEPTVRMLIVDALEDLGYACLEAADGASALPLIEAAKRLDLLITDVGLPGGLNGRQVAEAARKMRPDLKVLFITGYAENAVLNHGHVEHGMEVMTKPFSVDDLGGRVHRLLGDSGL